MLTLKIATLNINGINEQTKQVKLVSYLKCNGIQIAAIQEHNIKQLSKLKYLEKYYYIILNTSIQFKGGTLILIDRQLPIEISRVYLHPTSRMCTAYVSIFGFKLYLVNIYAPSGKQRKIEREAFFTNELIQQLVTNTDNLILMGDWNSVILKRDSTNIQNTSLSKSLKNIITSFKFKDVYAENRNQPEFTFYKDNYAARLDRIYLSKLFDNIQEVKTIAASFSDHLCVSVKFQLCTQIELGRPRWKLNTSLLTKDLIKQNFQTLWLHLQSQKRHYNTIIQWWEELVKPRVKKYFIMQGKEENNFKYGTLNYLEYKLRHQYEIANTSGIINKEIIDTLRIRIETIRDEMAEGIKIRAKLQDKLNGEKISNYIIAKQK